MTNYGDVMRTGFPGFIGRAGVIRRSVKIYVSGEFRSIRYQVSGKFNQILVINSFVTATHPR